MAGKSPAAADLALGELALNIVDGRLFCKKPDNTITVLNPAPTYTPSVVSLDMGTFPISARSFSVSVPGVAVGTDVVCSLSGDQANGSLIDEMEFEPLLVFARVASAGVLEFTIACASPFGVTSGIKYVNFFVG